MKRAFFSVTLLTMLASFSVQADNNIKADAPDGYTGYITYIGNGEAGLDSLNFVDIGPEAITCFQDVLGRDQAEIGQHLQDAISWSQMNMGLTVTPLDGQGNPVNPNASAWALPYSLRSDVGVRAYVVSGEKVPSSGWQVRDCGWQIVCVNPNGCPLSNDFAGQNLNPGSGFAYGDYVILADKSGNDDDKGKGKKDKKFVLPFTPAALVDQIGSKVYFTWNIESEDFGTCVAQGMINPKIDINAGTVKHNIRNTITCNDQGGL